MDLVEEYEIGATADFIHSGNFFRVGLQFPDNLLKDSTKVVAALRTQLQSFRKLEGTEYGDEKDVGLFVMADTTYGSCCIDEVGASHINADCVIHYGHTCLSSTTTLPAFFVFGKASIDVVNCAENILNQSLTEGNRILVLFGLEYAHSVQQIREALSEATRASRSDPQLEVLFADVSSPVMYPSKDLHNLNEHHKPAGGCTHDYKFGVESGTKYKSGGLFWNLPGGQSMEDFMVFWIGPDNSAFANVVLTFNSCEIVRYDPSENRMVTDLSQQRRILKRRYYLVERAKDAKIIGVLVGTLGVAGYLHMIQQMKELIAGAGKKAYTMVMGRPNPAKLANFPECDVFVYVSCAQTALLDSKEYLAPVITPFEALLAFSSGSQWTGAYVMEFQDLINTSPVGKRNQSEEARFSFLQGRYVEDFNLQENVEEENGALALVNATEKALQLHDNSNSLIKGNARSGAEFFASRSYQGLDMYNENPLPQPYFKGRSGRASGYEDEKSRDEIS
ncbi:2-(3-amino-3-carboxypropyl)histidine synthase subunit 2 [Quillaja saponaria]|uniref:2-(3-amino-3-carboxypropyl)histidine synthase subunit 2 n=1 Tax=Quillaja saponaria TaxID=32244 RepID=A0AAD7QFR8_QUISA|nr:2-(3-amino-3-carboxypropyl)histidine synthase subunit 2 [Quillaja saponaria]